jgi:hypothetical protein
MGAMAIFGCLTFSASYAPAAFAASVATNQAALGAQALTLADLPEGWTTTDAGAAGGGATAACGGAPFGPAHRIADVEASFEDPAGLPQVFEEIAVYNSTFSVFDNGVKVIDRCHTVAVHDGGIKLKIRVAKLAYPGGKLTAAYTLKFELKGEKVGIDLVAQEIGNEIVQMSVANVPNPNLELVKQLVSEAVDKVKISPRAPG